MWLWANVTREYSGELVQPTKSMWKGLRSGPHRSTANTDVRLAYGQERTTDWLTQKQSLKRDRAGIQRTAILTGWMAELQAAYLKVCHNLSRGKKEADTRSAIKARKIVWRTQNLNWSWAGPWEITNGKKKRMFGDGHKDTCCLTGSTWQFLPCGALNVPGTLTTLG